MTFNILDHIKGRTYPEDTVTVYIDEARMHQVAILDALCNSEVDGGKVAAMEKEIVALQKEIDKTSLTFHLKGFPDEVRDALKARADEIEDEKENSIFQDVSALEASTVKVTNANGDSAEFDYDSLLAILNVLPGPERGRLIAKVVELSYEAILYERVETNPDF